MEDRGPESLMKKPRGVALNPKHKELIVANMRLNSVPTCPWRIDEVSRITLAESSWWQ